MKTMIKNEKRRKQMKRTKHLFTAVLAIMVFSMVLAAQPFMGKRMGGRRMMKPSPTKIYMMLKAKQKDFNITDNQLEQIKNKVFALEEKSIPIESKNKLHRLELKKLMMNEKKDYGKISALLSKMSDNRQAIFIERLKTKDAINSILTPQQRDAIKEARQNRFKNKNRMFPRKGMRGKGMKQRGFFHRGDSQDFEFNDDRE
jgi:Spy/CpxP family protein refolding chaperone